MITLVTNNIKRADMLRSYGLSFNEIITQPDVIRGRRLDLVLIDESVSGELMDAVVMATVSNPEAVFLPILRGTAGARRAYEVLKK